MPVYLCVFVWDRAVLFCALLSEWVLFCIYDASLAGLGDDVVMH